MQLSSPRSCVTTGAETSVLDGNVLGAAGGQGARGSISQDLYRGAIGQSAGQMMRQSSRRASIAAGALLKQLQVHSHPHGSHETGAKDNKAVQVASTQT